MFTIIGVVLIILAIYQWSVKSFNAKRKEEDVNATFKKSLLPTILPTKPLITMVIGFGVLLLNGLFFYANPGTVYSVQYPWGGDKMVATQGISLKFWGRLIPITQEMSIQDRILSEGEKVKEDTDGIFNRKAKQWEFNDAIKADIAFAVVVSVDTNDGPMFLSTADKNRSENKLVYGRILPNIDAVLKNTCKLMDAQDYISGNSAEFDRIFADQLANGMYQIEEYYDGESSSEIIGDSTTVRKIISNSKLKKTKKKFRIKKDELDNIIRSNSNSFSKYGLTVEQAFVTGIDWEPSFDTRLDAQKNEVALTQLEKQQAEREFYRAKKETAAGESEKAKERAKLEKEQIKLTIAAETQAKVATQNLIAEKKIYEVEVYKAKSKKVAADAQFYENAKLVQAGLTPQERAEWDYKTAVGVAAEIKMLKLPSTYIEGSSGKGGNLLESLIGADLAKGMLGTKK